MLQFLVQQLSTHSLTTSNKARDLFVYFIRKQILLFIIQKERLRSYCLMLGYNHTIQMIARHFLLAIMEGLLIPGVLGQCRSNPSPSRMA